MDKYAWQDDYEYRVGQTEDPRLGWLLHLRVWRRDGQEIAGWDILQTIKNDVLGRETNAVEIYPPQDELVDDGVNMRHLWAGRYAGLTTPSLLRR